MDLPEETLEVVEAVGPHPLAIHLIAESIFSQINSISDLLRCREVAWAWRQIVTPLINSRSHEFDRMTFSGSEAEIENPSNPEPASSPLSKLTKYINYLKEEAEMEPKFLFSNFRFYNLPLEQPIVQQFLNEFGHTIRKLGLTAHKEADYEKFEAYEEHSRSGGSVESFWRLLTQCPELQELKVEQMIFQTTNEDNFPEFRSKIKRLTITHYNYYMFEKLRQLQPLITNLFRNCHLLERLILHPDICSDVFASALCESPHLSALKELTLEDAGVIEALRENPVHSEIILRNLRLSKFKICSLAKEHLDELNWFLHSQKTSLETLIITWYEFRSLFQQHDIQPEQPPRQLPSSDVMEKLREFEIRMVFKIVPCTFHPIDFRRQFPCLNKFLLEGDANNLPMDSWFVAGSLPQLTLEDLQLPRGISQEHLASAGKIFPNVKQLWIGKLGELAVRQLFSQWPQLESLYLQEFEQFEDPDSLLTGLSPSQLEAAEKIRAKMGMEIHGIISLINPSKVAPSIANFKGLKTLIVHSIDQRLTDLSLRYAISKLENLEYLSVNGYKFSEEGIKDFRNSIPHLQLRKDVHIYKPWGETFWYQRDLSKRYNSIPFIDDEFATDYD